MPISIKGSSFVVNGSQSVSLASMFADTPSATNPTYLVLTGLDRNEYTASATGATGNVVQSVLLQTGTADAQYIANKETVGAHFALTQGLSDGNWAKTVMSGVNGTAASVTAANALADGFAATAATAAGSELVVKILGIVA